MDLDHRVRELEVQVLRLQRLVRVLAFTVLTLAAVVLLPVIIDVLTVLVVIGLLGALVWAVRQAAEGEWSRLMAPARAVLACLKSPRPA